MNSLSWMIYAAEVVDRVGVGMTAFGFLALIVGVALSVVGNVVWDRYSWDKEDTWTQKMAIRDKLRRIGFGLVIVGPPLLIAAAITPSSKTIYLIAASEAGETVIASPEAREMFNDLQGIIRKKLKDELGSSSPDTTKT